MSIRVKLQSVLWLSGIAIVGGGAGHAVATEVAPQAMSINLCADQLLLALLPPQRISSVSWLARDASQSYFAAAAAMVPINYGTAEEVARQRPDVLIAGTYTTPATRALLRRVGNHMLELPPMNNFEEIRAGTRLVADAVGARVRAEQLLKRMDERLAWLAEHPLPHAWRILVWNGNGTVPGPGSLYDAVLTNAGGYNAAADHVGSMYAQFDIETLLRHAPEVIVQSDPAFAYPGRHNDAAQHAIIGRYWAGRRVYLPRAATECGTPFTADIAWGLHQDLAGLRAP